MRGRLNKDMLTAIQKSFDSNIGVEVKMILVPEDYHKAIQKDSEILEILESYNDPLVDLQIENATLEYKSNQEENDGEEYKYGDRFHT